MLSRNYNINNNILKQDSCYYNYNCNSFGTYGMSPNSIFNMQGNFFTNCNGEPNYDAMAGVGVAYALIGVLNATVSQIVVNKKSNSSETINANINGYLAQINKNNEKLEELGDVTKGADWYQEEERKYKEDILDDETLKTYKDNISKYNVLYKEFSSLSSDSENYKEKKEQLAEAKKLKDAADEMIKKHEQAVKDLKALEEKRKAKEDEAKKIKDENEELQALIDAAQKQLDAKIAKKVDGNKATRNTKFTAENVNKEYFTDFKKNDLKNLNFQFTHLDDGQEKFRYAEAIYKLDQAKFNEVTNGDKNYAQVRKWAVDYYLENKNKYENK